MQMQFQYTYSGFTDARKQAKKLRSPGCYVWIIRHPKTGRYVILESDNIEDRPTRVPVEEEFYTPPYRRPAITDAERWQKIVDMVGGGRININRLGEPITGDEFAALIDSEIESD